MRGMIGTAMGGNSRKAALKRNLPALIKAKDIIKLFSIEDTSIIEIEILKLCEKAVNSPSLLLPHESRIIHGRWVKLAESGKLRGIRNRKK